jgi:hypothetical protein
MIEDYFVLDNVIPKRYQDDIENLLLNNQVCPWYLVKDISYTENVKEFNQLSTKFTAFSHVFKNENGPQSKVFDFLIPLVYSACEKIDFELKNIVMARSFLQLTNTQGINNAHIDFQTPHLVLLYYVNDCQGSTILYNEKYPDIRIEELANKELTVLTTIEPKKGRCVLFDGFRYHSSSGPDSGIRCVINFDLQ